MKKFLLTLLCVAGFVAVNAENPKALTGQKFLDNWSVGVNAGITQPLAHPYSLDANMRGLFGVELYKQFTPVFKAGAEINFGVNTTGIYGVRGVRTAFDTHNLSLNGGLNLMNLFGGYKGTPRLFEIEAIGGIGWGHMYTNYEVDGPAYNYMTTKFGINLNFNLGKDKAWTLGIKPAIVYDIEGRTSNNGVKFDTNYANIELQAGLAYHFKTSNGTHHFVYEDLYDQAQIDDLNGKINKLRSDLDAKDGELGKANKRISDLEKALKECQEKKPVVEKVVKVEKVVNSNLESMVTFRQGKTVIDASQRPNVERVATYMKNHKNAKVSIKGYASPEGNIDINKRLAEGRAQAVKDMLVNTYKISADRINAEGQGVGDMFSEPDWNRVSICTLEE